MKCKCFINKCFCVYLLFPLCKTCGDTTGGGVCTHTDTERAITGTLCHVELLKAPEKGYEILRLHEVWHFPEQSNVGTFGWLFFTEYFDIKGSVTYVLCHFAQWIFRSVFLLRLRSTYGRILYNIFQKGV